MFQISYKFLIILMFNKLYIQKGITLQTQVISVIKILLIYPTLKKLENEINNAISNNPYKK